MTNLTLDLNGLLVCVDDTGYERLAGNHEFYGVGGCGILMRDYEHVIAGPWRAVRRAVAGSEATPLHASDFSRKATSDQKELVAAFFKGQPFMRIGAAGTRTAKLPSCLPLMQVVLESLKKRIVEVAR